MANCFLVKFPPDWSRAKRNEFTEFVGKQCFMQLPTYDDENQAEFLLEQNNHTVESFRERFKIPAECDVFDSSDWVH